MIYYLNQSACSYAKDKYGHYAICPQYFFSKGKVKEYNKKIEKEVNSLVEKLELMSKTDYEKEITIHDWFCKNIMYDGEGADREKTMRIIASHNILGVFAHRTAQCEGIAKSVKVLLNTVDVKCIVVTGKSIKSGRAVSHAWNIVNIAGQPYHLDVTWDIGANDLSFQMIPYDYFNIPDWLIGKEHKTDIHLPTCSFMQHNFFVVNKITFCVKDRLLSYIEKSLQEGNTEFYFRINDKIKASDLEEEICNLISAYFFEHDITERRVKRIINDIMGTIWIKIY